VRTKKKTIISHNHSSDDDDNVHVDDNQDTATLAITK
jgi:hypothetical protein